MSDCKLKHLEFIQGVISRMASNSFLIKGWAITIIVGLFALGTSMTKVIYVYLAVIPIISFWILDGYYLWQERLYRELWKDVSKKKEKGVDFSMDASVYNNKSCKLTWIGSVFSPTIFIIYIFLIITLVILIFCCSGRV